MQKFYRIHKIGAGFDGLVAEGGHPFAVDFPGVGPVSVVSVHALHNPNQIVGDRIVSNPVIALYIESDRLIECDDPRLRQFDTRNPWGKCLLEGELKKNGIIVSYAQFEHAFQVSVYEKGNNFTKTLYTNYFYLDPVGVKETIENAMSNDREDELVFLLQDMKRTEGDRQNG